MEFTLIILFSACTVVAFAHIVAVVVGAVRKWRSGGAVSHVERMLLPWGELGVGVLVFAVATVVTASAAGTIAKLDVLTAALVAVSTTLAGAAVVRRAGRAVLVAGVLALVVLPAVVGFLYGYVGPRVDQA